MNSADDTRSIAVITISTHVLDLQRGCPAAGIRVHLLRDGEAAAGTGAVTAATTDHDGRVVAWADEVLLVPGAWTLRFEVGSYFAALGIDSFYEDVIIGFRAADGGAHYHVPLLLSPFGYSTYRGS